MLAGVPASRLYPEDESLADVLLVAATEMVMDEDIDALGAALEGALA